MNFCDISKQLVNLLDEYSLCYVTENTVGEIQKKVNKILESVPSITAKVTDSPYNNHLVIHLDFSDKEDEIAFRLAHGLFK